MSPTGPRSFTVTDLAAEDLTLTATDTDDGVEQFQKTSSGVLSIPPAACCIRGGSLPSVNNDGKAQAIITAHASDSLDWPTPGKLA